MTAYWLNIPTWLSNEFLAEIETLKAMWENSLKWALEAWILFEIRDIEDITEAIIASNNEDVRKVMLNIGGGSFNHLRGFLNNLEKQGFTTDIDYSEFLNGADLEEKWLKDRFVIYLENRWINIDASLLNKKDTSENWNKWNENSNKNWNKWNNEAIKNLHKIEVRSILLNKLDRLDDLTIQRTINNINKLKENIRNSNMRQEVKQNQMIILNAIEEVLNEIKLTD